MLLPAMVLFGASMSLVDVAINTEGSELETVGGRAIMSSLHGMFSVGGMLGAGLTFGLLEMHVGPRAQLFTVGGCLAVVALVASRAMLRKRTRVPTATRSTSPGRRASFS